MGLNRQVMLILALSLTLVSGQLDNCYILGECNGVTIGSTTVSSYNRCLEECKLDEGNCNWVTYKVSIMTNVPTRS